jgi:hypothetical protein
VLSRALGDPTIDLDAQLAAMHEHFADAVPSLLSATLTVKVDGGEFSVTTRPRADTSTMAKSSLLIPLSTVTAHESTTAELLLRAASPGALVDLAADGAHMLGVDLAAVTLDNHLGPVLHDNDLGADTPSVNEASSAFADRAVIDNALGILLETNGFQSIGDARTALHARAEREGITPHSAAQRIVTDATAAQPDPSAHDPA